MEATTVTIAQQIADARTLAAGGQPSSAVVYYETLLPQLTKCAPQIPTEVSELEASKLCCDCRLIASVTDAHRQGQYSSVLKALQEEYCLLKELDAALCEIKQPPVTAPRPSLVCARLACKIPTAQQLHPTLTFGCSLMILTHQ